MQEHLDALAKLENEVSDEHKPVIASLIAYLRSVRVVLREAKAGYMHMAEEACRRSGKMIIMCEELNLYPKETPDVE